MQPCPRARARPDGSACLSGARRLRAVDDRDWPAYGGDAGKTRHSPLTQINRDTVGKLALAWSYDTGEKGDTQTQPIVVGGVMYAYTPTHKTIALDAATGKLLWSFDSGIAGVGANRGLMYWREGREARVFAAVDNFVYALDAATGKVIAGFGKQGRIDLREDLGPRPGNAVRATNYSGRHLSRPDDRRRPRGRESAGLPGPHPRLRRALRRIALDLPHHPAAGRARP